MQVWSHELILVILRGLRDSFAERRARRAASRHRRHREKAWDGDAIPRDQPARGRRGQGMRRISRPDSLTSSHVSEPPAGELNAIGPVPVVKANGGCGGRRSGRDPLRVGLASVVFPVLEIITGEALDSRAALTFVVNSNYVSHVLADGR